MGEEELGGRARWVMQRDWTDSDQLGLQSLSCSVPRTSGGFRAWLCPGQRPRLPFVSYVPRWSRTGQHDITLSATEGHRAVQPEFWFFVDMLRKSSLHCQHPHGSTMGFASSAECVVCPAEEEAQKNVAA